MTRSVIVQGARKGLAAVVAAALILAAPGPGCYEAWAAAQRETGEIPQLGGGAGAPVTPAQIPEPPSNGNISGSVPVLPESNISEAAAPASFNETSIASPARKAATVPVAASIPVANSFAAPAAKAAGQSPAATAATQLLRTSGQNAAEPSGSAQAPDVDALQASSGRLFDNSRGQAGPGASPAFAGKSGTAVKAAAGLGAALAAAHSGRALAGATIKAAAGHVGAAAAAVVQSGLPWYSNLGNVVGNGLAFYFAVPQIYQTLKDGNAGSTPKLRAIAMIVASLLLGGLNAVIAQSMFWGVQNLFGGISMAAVFPIAKMLKGRGVSPGKAKWITAGVVVGLLGASAGLYLLASMVVPGLIAAALPATVAGTQALLQGFTAVLGGIIAAFVMKKAFSLREPQRLGPASLRETLGKAFLALLAAAIAAGGLLPAVPAFLTPLLFPMTASQVTVAIQAVTSVLFLTLFAPDIVSIAKGKVPESFTTGFSASFFLSSIGFLAWMKGELAQTPPHTSGWVRWQIYFWVNVVYAVVSAISYWAARKEAKAKARGHKPGDEDVPPTPPTPPSLRLNLLPETPEASQAAAEAPAATKLFSAQPMSLLEAKAAAQARARKLSPGAQLSLASLDLTDPQARWVFVFRGKRNNHRLKVEEKRIEIDAWPSERSSPVLWSTRLAAAPSLDEALARLKERDPEFRPVRLELRPNWKGDPDVVFIDGSGRQTTLPAKPPVRRIFLVRPMTLAEIQAQAQTRALKLLPGARLDGASIDLTGSQGRWIFRFRGDDGRRLSIEIDAPPVVRSASSLEGEHFPAAPGVALALIRLKETEPAARPVRLELRHNGKGAPDAVFIDAAGREFKLPQPSQGTTAALVKVPAALAAQPTSPSPAQPPPEPPKALPPGPPPADRAPPEQAAAKDQPQKRPQVLEDFFGFRRVVGVKHDTDLKSLPLNASSSQIVDQISRQFNISRQRVLEIARFRQEKGQGFDENSPAQEWYAVYRRLQKLNAEQFKRLDHEKYEGFRHLANRTYASGWKGALARAAEVHKHFIGVFVRFPYHLFDMFVLGYFRQSLSFELSHKTEDFLGVNAEKWLEVAFKEQAPNGLTAWEKAMASPWGQIAEPILNVTVIPLATFLKRRVTMALASAVIMGLLGAAAPGLTVMSLSLTAVPLLGPALMVLAHGLPIAVAQVPFVGGILAPVVGAATTALLKDMVIGPLLNTLALSTLLTVPGAVRMERMRLQDADPRKPVPWSRAVASLATSPKTLARTGWQVAKTFFGMVTVGAEIAGILNYAGQADMLLSKGVGHHVTPFHSAASAIESQKGDSVIPFGGAITWGNALLYQAQNWLGFNISDHVMWLANPNLQHAHANEVYQAAAHRQARDKNGQKLKEDPDYKFDADLGKKSAKEIAERLKYLADNAGDIGKEMQGAREQQAALRRNLSAADDRIAREKAKLDPPEKRRADQARLKELKAQLDKLRDESYGRSKLAEVHDLKNPQQDSQRAKELAQLLDDYNKVLPEASSQRAGFTDSLAVRQAALENLLAAVGGGGAGGGQGHNNGAVGVDVSDDTRQKFKQIDSLLSEIDALRSQAQGEMATRDATGELLAVVNRARNAALNDRRSGKEMLAIHQNMSKLATVMDLSLALNEVNSAEKAISQMQTLLNNKEQQINQALQQNQQNDQQAQQNQQQIQNYQNQNQQQIKSDQATQASLAANLTRTQNALNAFQGYQTQTQALINAIQSADGQNPLTLYNQRMQTMQQWANSGGPPSTGGIPDAKTIASMQSEVSSALQTAQQGLTKIQTGQIPTEYFGALLIVPGGAPGSNFTLPDNPNPQQALQYLGQVRSSWQPELAKYQGYLNTVNNIMTTKTITNAFGDTISLAQMQALDAQSQASTKQYVDQINALAAKISQECPKCNANLPALPDNNLKQLEQNDVFTNYANALQAIQVPNDGSVGSAAASTDILAIAQALPYAGKSVIDWAYADGVVTAFNQALTTTLPQAQQGLTGLVNMVNAILADNQQDANFINAGQFSQQTFTALETRKTGLLQSNIIPALQGAQALLTALSQYQTTSNADYAPNANGGGYYQYYTAKAQLWNSVQSAYGQTIPWAMETFGGPSGNAAASHAAVASYRTEFNNYLNGYTDSNGNNFIGINNYITEVGERTDPKFNGTEQSVPKMFQIPYLQDSNYPGGGPFSLPQKIALYQTEMAQRAQQINTEDAQIDQILDQLKTISKGKYDLSAYKLPTNVGVDQGSVQTVTNLTNNVVQKLADQLKAIGNANNTSTTINIPGGGATVPTGNQGQLTISQQQQIAILALNAAQRLVPSSVAQPAGAPATYAMARFLYSNGIIQGVQQQLAPTGELAQAKQFLPQAQSVLNSAVAATNQADAYIDSGGASLTAQQIYQGQTQLFQSLSGMLQQAGSFFNVVIQADNNATGTINQVGTYYNGLNTIYSGGATVDQSELTEVTAMQTALQKELTSLQADKAKISSWLGQLNDPHDSALRRVSDSIDALQDKTRAVLVENIRWHDLSDQLKRSNDILGADLKQLEDKQETLKRLVRGLSGEERSALASPRYEPTLKRIDDLHLDKGVWAIDGKGQAQALVVRKDRYAAFVDSILGVIAPQGSASQDLGLIRADLLKNPGSLAQLIPGARLMDFGNDADGFYMVYQSQFGVPNGLNTGSWVTMGNVTKIFGSNVSVTGYQFESPPEEKAVDGASNAPWGDKGVEVQIETLKGKNWINYLNIDLHHFALDIPPTPSLTSRVDTTRVMLFDDFAMMSAGGKLYLGLTGFGDVSANQPGDHPYYYGGNLKTSIQLSPVMALTAQQQELFAKDPRSFLETVNLDFTGYDPSLNQTFAIAAAGDAKHYSRTQLGPSINVAQLLHSPDPFTLDLYYANSGGTDDITQKAAGVSILKGFTLHDSQGKPLAIISNKTTLEKGQRYNTYADQLSVTLPKSGIVVSGQGQLLGNAEAFYGQVAKKMSDTSSIALGYGKQYVGENNRLSVTLNTNFTLGQLWQSVVNNAGRDLRGADALEGFNAHMNAFFDEADGKSPDAAQIAELRDVFVKDVSRKLISQQIGTLSRDIAELRKAGAVMDNTRTRGTVGFVTRAVSTDKAAEAIGGGFAAGTETEMTLSKTQKDLIDSKAASLYADGLKLQERLLDLTKQWQQAVADIAQARAEAQVAAAMEASAPNEVVRRQAQVHGQEAKDRLHQARLRYNALAGRDLEASTPFDGMDAASIPALFSEVGKIVAAPDRMDDLFKGLHDLDQDRMEEALGKNPRNIADMLKFVDRFSIGIGAQMQDLMASQIFGIGGSVRLPIYDPHSKAADKSYALESKATFEQIRQMYADQHLRAELEEKRSRQWTQAAAELAPESEAARRDLSVAVRSYRNGLSGEAEMDRAYAAWRWYMENLIDASANAAVGRAQAALDGDFKKTAAHDADSPVTIGSFEQALDLVQQRSHGLAELGQRAQAAADMMTADNHRIQKFWLDLDVGMNLTATGVGWLPKINYTGIPIMPVPGVEFKPAELRELQVKEDQSDQAYYRALEGKVKSDLAVELYENLAAYQSEQKAVEQFDAAVLPSLESRAAGLPSRQALDRARLERQGHALARDQAKATINYLLGRSADAPLTVGVDADRALDAVRSILQKNDPHAAEKAVLRSRLDAAVAHEQIVDKDLKVTQAAAEPISLAGRTLGRLIKALSDEDVGDPDQVAAARVRTLTEQRALESYDDETLAKANGLRSRLQAVELERGSLNKANPQGQARDLALQGEEQALKAGLLALGDVRDPSGGLWKGRQPMPETFERLRDRLAAAEEMMTGRAPEAAPAPTTPGLDTRQATLYLRNFYARQELDRVPIHKDYVEGWLELRLKSSRTPPEVLLALAQLETQKADRLYRNDQAGAAAKAAVLAEDFRASVQARRWLEREIRNPVAGSPQNMAPLDKELKDRLEADRAQIVSALGLDPEQATLKALEALVPEDGSGPQELASLSEQLIGRMREAGLRAIRQTVLDEASEGASEDGLISQIKADNLAQRMTYKGFTPIAAFGLFRGQKLGAGFLEAPDPRQVERGLTNILDESLRKDLEASGRMEELSTRLRSLMVKVQDGSEELESRRALVEAAERDYRAKIGLASEGRMRARDVEEQQAARERLAGAWTAFAEQLVQTKADFVTLVSDIEAIDPKLITQHEENRAPTASEGDFGSWASDRRQDLLDYWTDRMLDKDFVGKQAAALSELGANIPQNLRDALALDTEKFQLARRDADAVMDRDFTPEQRLRLLSINDLEGKRERLRADLVRLHEFLSASDPKIGYLAKDLEDQAAKAGKDRQDFAQAARELREAYWSAVPPSDPGVEGAFHTLETLKGSMQDARQKLLKAYMAGNTPEHTLAPSEFVLKDKDLDEYLKAEEAFDAELVKTLQDPAVKGSRQLMWNLDTLYNARATVARASDEARAGRGMLALDALIMLEESRLAAARWNGRPPQEIDQIAQALESLRETEQRWKNKETDLKPLYAVTTLKRNGERVWTVSDWMTQGELDQKLKDHLVIEGEGAEKGRYFLAQPAGADGSRQEVAAGVDVREAAQRTAQAAYAGNHAQAELEAKFGDQDLIALPLGSDKAEEGQGYSLGDVFFGDESLYAKDKVLFFEKNPAPGYAVHRALNPIQALQMNPDQYQVVAYFGAKGAQEGYGRSDFLTLESVQDRKDPDFKDIRVTAKGVQDLIVRAQADARAQRAQGWIDVKLNSYGFAVDGKGNVAELYLTKEEFAAARGALASAQANYERADAAYKAAQDAESAAQRAYREAQKASGGVDAGSNGAYQASRAKATADLTQAFAAVLAKQVDEADLDQRVKIEVDKRLSGDKNFEQTYAKQIEAAAQEGKAKPVAALDQETADYQKAQKVAAPQAQKLTAAENAYNSAKANTVNAESARKDAKTLVDRVKDHWSLYESDGLTLILDGAPKDGAPTNLVGVSARPEFGPRVLSDPGLGSGAGSVRIQGPLYAAQIDKQGRIVHYFDDEDKLDKASAGWTLKSVAMSGGDDNVTVGGDRRLARPTVRISHYEAPLLDENRRQIADAKGRPAFLAVDLSRRYLLERSRDDSGKAKHDEHWGLLPWQWGDLLMEVPRGLIDTPFEAASGRDPRQDHYLGRVYMYKTEGGWTEHKGFFRGVAGAIDVLDLLPDHAERFSDLSQFPAQVRINSPIKPGQDIADKKMRDGEHDVHFGATAMRRMERYDLEDLTAAKARTLDHFNGGVEQVWVDQVRGRAGYYEDSRRESVTAGLKGEDPGQAAIDQTLADPLLAGANLFTDGRMTLSAVPGNLAVRRVERQVDVRRGAAQYENQAGRLKDYFGRLKDPAALDADLQKDAAAKRAALEKDLSERQRNGEQARGVFDDYHARNWHEAEQEAIEAQIKELVKQRDAWQREFDIWKDYLDQLAKIPLPGPRPVRPGKDYGNGGLLAAWALVGFGLAAVLSAAYEWLRRRKPDVEPPSTR